jgi:hypothetical protein
MSTAVTLADSVSFISVNGLEQKPAAADGQRKYQKH